LKEVNQTEPRFMTE